MDIESCVSAEARVRPAGLGASYLLELGSSQKQGHIASLQCWCLSQAWGSWAHIDTNRSFTRDSLLSQSAPTYHHVQKRLRDRTGRLDLSVCHQLASSVCSAEEEAQEQEQ